MIVSVQPLLEINDLEPIAYQFSQQLVLSENQDIAQEFPNTVERYGTDTQTAYENLVEARDDCTVGLRE